MAASGWRVCVAKGLSARRVERARPITGTEGAASCCRAHHVERARSIAGTDGARTLEHGDIRRVVVPCAAPRRRPRRRALPRSSRPSVRRPDSVRGASPEHLELASFDV